MNKIAEGILPGSLLNLIIHLIDTKSLIEYLSLYMSSILAIILIAFALFSILLILYTLICIINNIINN